MLSLALATSALFALAHAAAPVAFTASVSVVVDDKQPASRADKTVVVPELIGDGLTISIADYNGVEYKACLKLGVAAPVSAGMANWENALYCELFHFTNVTSAATASFKLPVRARSVPSNLRGVGSEAGAVAADAVVVDSMHVSALARRSVEAASAGQRGAATKNVRAGEYFVTIAPVSPQKSNATLTLNFSGMTCGAGNAGANCAPLPVLTAGTSFTVTGILPNTSAIAQLGNYEQINGTTASVTVAAEVDSPNGDVLIAARWGALPTATLFDASFLVAKANTPTVATLPAPRAARWYFGIFNTNKTAVTANVTVTFAQCGAGKFGPTCNTTVTPATVPGQTIANDNVKTGAQFYYTFHRNTTALFADAVNAAALAFAAAQIADPDANATAPSIYARVGALPTTSDFDYVDCTVQCSDEQNTLIVPASDVATSLESQPWYLLVVANTDGSLVAWNAAGGACAGNCTAHGTCDAANALCTCTDDYAAFDCADKKSALERWEWALIIGGAVLVAIGLIGCIVYFIQRQSRRAGFERV